MPKNRRCLEIIADVLRAAKNNGKKTRIMYFANLSHTLLEKYLERMVGNGLISFAGNGYEVTDKGEAFLRKYSGFSSRYKKVEGSFRALMSEKEMLEKMCNEGCKKARAMI